MNENKECYEKIDLDNLRGILDYEIDNTINKLKKLKKKLNKVDININVLTLCGYIYHFYDIQAIIKDINSDLKRDKEFNELEKELEELGKKKESDKK